MGVSAKSLLSLAAVGVILAGCQSARMDDSYSPPIPSAPAAPLAPAPSGTVQKGDLSSPATFPEAPQTNPAGQPGDTQIASLPPASAPDLTPGAVAGVWTASLGGQSCKIATPQTKYGQGYRAGPLRCPGELGNLASWAVNGKQLTLYDGAGGTVATLYATGPGSFNGQTSGGQALTLSR
ncbi:protease inhibitor Inh/omp19 family protein [Daeguia caeni]|uniref:Protease inhibitor Inh/omp19 family protein n=1 Tax=Daeguia caeni TaxID=439612 RepID=A0ABV9HA95_9HYPH